VISKINERQDIFGDNIAYVEQWDFSKANLSYEHRVQAITRIASACYANPNVIGKETLYNRLKAESKGLPSSSFEFVPVLLNEERISRMARLPFLTKTFKHGEFILSENASEDLYLLTNYRALLYDYEMYGDEFGEDITQWYNTEEECREIAKHFKVFKSKLDLPTRTQYIRHRVSWQEQSRRYVSGKKVPFEFYISDGMKPIISNTYMNGVSDDTDQFDTIEAEIITSDVINVCVNHYFAALKAGVQPQEARRIIPQAAYTVIWSAWQPEQLKNFFDLRLDKHAQWEIRKLAGAKKGLLEDIPDEK